MRLSPRESLLDAPRQALGHEATALAELNERAFAEGARAVAELAAVPAKDDVAGWSGSRADA